MKKEHVVLSARAVLGAVFAVSGFLKATQPPQEFAAVIDAYFLISPAAAMTMAQVLPWAELVGGVFLLAGVFTRAVSALLGGMLAMFELALLSTITRGMEMKFCGCFGQGFHVAPWQAMIMDAMLLAAAYLCFKNGAAALSVDAWAQGAQPDHELGNYGRKR